MQNESERRIKASKKMLNANLCDVQETKKKRKQLAGAGYVNGWRKLERIKERSEDVHPKFAHKKVGACQERRPRYST